MTDHELDIPVSFEQHSSAAGHRKVRDQSRAASRRCWRPRRMVVVIAVAGLVVAGGGVATAVAGLGSVTDRSTARCYSEISSDFSDDFPGTTVGTVDGADGSDGVVVAPLSVCAAVWEQTGVLQGAAPQDARPPHPVPHLVGCVLPDGRAAVYPGPDDTCERLGLETASEYTGSASTSPGR